MRKLMTIALLLTLTFFIASCISNSNGSIRENDDSLAPTGTSTDLQGGNNTKQPSNAASPNQDSNPAEPDNTPTCSEIIIIDELDPIKGYALLSLGMPGDEAWEALIDNLGIEASEGGNAFYSSIDDDGREDCGYHRYHAFSGFDYLTDINNKVYHVGFGFLGLFQSKEGLRISDTPERVIELYGSDYTEYTEEVKYGDLIWEYAFGNHYFSISFSEGKVFGWSVSLYSEQTFRDSITDSVRPD